MYVITDTEAESRETNWKVPKYTSRQQQI